MVLGDDPYGLIPASATGDHPPCPAGPLPVVVPRLRTTGMGLAGGCGSQG